MRYLIEIKKLVRLIKFCKQNKKFVFKCVYKPAYIPFLKFLISFGIIYYYTVISINLMCVFIKPESHVIRLEQKNLLFTKYRYRYIKKNLYKLDNVVICFSTDRGLLSGPVLKKQRLGGLHLITV